MHQSAIIDMVLKATHLEGRKLLQLKTLAINSMDCLILFSINSMNGKLFRVNEPANEIWSKRLGHFDVSYIIQYKIENFIVSNCNSFVYLNSQYIIKIKWNQNLSISKAMFGRI